MLRHTVRIGVLVAGAVLIGAAASLAQEAYRTPPDVVRAILEAPRLPELAASPDGETLVLASTTRLPTIEDLSQPMLRLAGLRLNPKTNGRFTTRWYHELTVVSASSGEERSIVVPANARLSEPGWSPDGRRIAFTNATEAGTELWIADPRSGEATKVTEAVLNGTMGDACHWMPDSEHMLCNTVPGDRGPAPIRSRVPSGPIVQRTSGEAAPVRTYQDLLKSPFDERQFSYHATGQIAIVEVATGARTDVGDAGIYLEWNPSPSGEAILVRRVRLPFSYLVPVFRFAHDIEIWNRSGQVVHTVASVPLADRVPIGGVRTGPRNVDWQAGKDATLMFVAALDGGHTRRPAAERDQVMLLAPPYTEATELARLAFRYDGIRWGRDGIGLLSESERATRRERTWVVHANGSGTDPRLAFDRSTEDRYNDPGTPMMTRDATGRTVLLQSPNGREIFLRGSGASPTGDRPFLDRYDLRSGEAQRLWQSGTDAYESIDAMLDSGGRRVVTRRETPTTPPNYLLRDLRSQAERPVTILTNPAPALATVRRELLTYERDDGVTLSGTLYYPTDYREGQKVPVIFWIYPREFASAAAAGQVRGSPNRFVLPGGSSHLLLLTQGYAILDNPTLPVVGEGDSPNDTYVEQTVAGAEAAIRHLETLGIADGNFGVGGHSYGAFATANLLAHSDLFKAGIARSGAYNRSLTPFGFQSERRTFWEATDVYLRMMPFAHADKINEPILLIHGMQDNNSGTFPVQSERMYHALKGHGATVEYVQLPYESHGYRARESMMDVVARMIEWFDRYVKGEATTLEESRE